MGRHARRIGRCCLVIVAISIVGAACVGVGVLLTMHKGIEQAREMEEVMALGNVLVSYAEQTGGQLPTSWDVLVRTGLMKRSSVDPRRVTAFVGNRPAGGQVMEKQIRNINKYRIAFGETIDDLRLKEGCVIGPQGNPILFIKPAGKSHCPSQFYSDHTMYLFIQLRKVSEQ